MKKYAILMGNSRFEPKSGLDDLKNTEQGVYGLCNDLRSYYDYLPTTQCSDAPKKSQIITQDFDTTLSARYLQVLRVFKAKY